VQMAFCALGPVADPLGSGHTNLSMNDRKNRDHQSFILWGTWSGEVFQPLQSILQIILILRLKLCDLQGQSENACQFLLKENCLNLARIHE